MVIRDPQKDNRDLDLRVKTWTVQRILAPLIDQVTGLVDGPRANEKNQCFRSQSSKTLLRQLSNALEGFRIVGKELINNCPSMRLDLQAALQDIASNENEKIKKDIAKALNSYDYFKDFLEKNSVDGNQMIFKYGNQMIFKYHLIERESINSYIFFFKGTTMMELSRKFVCDTRDELLRRKVAEQARDLLYSVTRLFVLADIIDTEQINIKAEEAFATLRSSSAEKKENRLDKWLVDLQRQISDIDSLFEQRQKDLIDGVEREQVAVLRKSAHQQLHLFRLCSTTLSGEKGCTRKIRETFGTQLSKLIKELVTLCSSNKEFKAEMECECVDIPNQMKTFLVSVSEQSQLTPLPYNARQLLESLLEALIRDVGLVIDSLDNNPDDRTCIANLCNAMRQSLQGILQSLEKAQNTSSFRQNLDRHSRELQTKSQLLLRKTRKILTAYYNDIAGQPDQTIRLIERLCADKAQNKKFLASLQAQNKSIIEVALILSTFAAEGVHRRCILVAVKRYAVLSKQLWEVAKSLCGGSLDNLTTEFWRTFSAYWKQCALLLIDSVDEACRIEDLLCACDLQILSAITDCLNCVQWPRQQRMGEQVLCRTGRLLSIVHSEMNRYEHGEYTELICQAIKILTDEGLPALTGALNANGFSMEHVRDKHEELVHATNAIYDGVREIRCAVLMNSALELPSDSEEGYAINEVEETQSATRISSPSDTTDQTSDSHAPRLPSEPGHHEFIPREVMGKLPQAERDQIEKQVRVLRRQKRTFDREVLKWDEKGNDIVMLARKMCIIMMEMSDFTRGQGPLRGTMDVINAAKKISDYGARLDKIARNIAIECVESQSKQDLLAYLDRVSLFTHQLNITSRVKADVQNISGELVVSGLDSAISLITSAKNLMNAVISVVKASYIASTKYRNKVPIVKTLDCPKESNTASAIVHPSSSQVNVEWHVKPPEKKPLHIVDQSISAKVRTE